MVCKDSTRSNRPSPGSSTTLIVLAMLMLTAGAASSAEWTVSNPAELQSRLVDAAANGQDDTINVAPGNYIVGSTLSFASFEPHTLSIRGAGIDQTVLDGGDPAQVQVLSIESFGSGASVTVSNMTLRDGLSAASTGGALHIETASGDITIRSCEILDSSVVGTDGYTIGGGASVTAISGQVSVIDCAFRRNTSSGNVGGLFATTQASILVSRSRFEDNSVDSGGESDYFGDGGGAMLYGEVGSDSQTATVYGCTFVGNTAAGGDNPDGGGLMIYQNGDNASAEVAGSTFYDNHAGLGGAGLFVRINATGSIRCAHNSFLENTAGTGTAGDGGGAHLYNTVGNTTVVGNLFAANQAAWDGGGLWLSVVDGQATVTGNRFIDNQSGSNGGGLFVFTEAESSETNLSFNLFRSNDAANVGGGVSYASTAGTLHLRATTFFDNTATADGGGLYIYKEGGAAPTISDLILWNDLPNELGFSGAGTGGLTVLYSDVQGGGGEPWLGVGCLSIDPMFRNPATGDLRLSWDNYPVMDATMSPCIDAGDPASPPDPDGTRADMGALPFATVFDDAFESATAYAWSAVYQPWETLDRPPL